MTGLSVAAFGLVFLSITGYGQDQKAATIPFTLTWSEGRCIGCKTARRLSRIQVVNHREMWAVGFDHPLRGSFVVVHSTDAGRTWKELPQVHEYAGPDRPPAFWFLDRARGWIAWLDDQTNEFEMIHTQDAGEHWQNVSQQSLQEVRFFDDNNGYGADGANFLRTNDGGRTWTETTIPHTRYIGNMVFLTPDNGWIAGADGKDLIVFRTINGGHDWEESRTNAPNEVGGVRDMFFVDQDTGWLTTWNLDLRRSYLFSTVDGGKHWAPDPAFQGKDKWARTVRFLSKERGFVFVDEAKGHSLMYTTDGGAHWYRLALPRFVHDCQVFEGDLLCGAEPPGFSLLTVHPK